MSQQKFLNPNRIWFTIVLLHIVGSVLDSVLAILPFGRIIAAIAIWFFLANIQEKNIRRIEICIAGCIITIFMMYSLDISYQGTILLNELLLLYVFWVCQNAYVKPVEYCHLRKVSLKSIGLIIVAAIFLFIMADYVNACSMIAFQNLLDDSLQAIVNKPVEALVVVAILPAIIEEFLFRGMIYRGIANKSNKKIVIIISALLFAFLHMNFNQMCYAFVMGLVFAIVIYLTDNLSVSILLHMLFNAFTVIITCFEKSNAIQAILQCNIAGYTLFNPSLTDTQGKIEISLLIIGGLIAILSAVIAGWLILLIAKTEKTTETTINNENILKDNDNIFKNNENWKPDLRFFAGSGVCILIAILRQHGAQPCVARAAGRRRFGHPQKAKPQEPAGKHLGPVVVIVAVEAGERRVPVSPHGRRARPDAEKEIAEPLPLHAFGKGAPVGAAFQPLRPADGPEVFLLHGFAKIRIQQQFVSAQAGCKAVIRLAGLHCFHKSTF